MKRKLPWAAALTPLVPLVVIVNVKIRVVGQRN